MVDFDIYFKDSKGRSYDELEDFVFENGFEDANFGSAGGVYMLSFEDEIDNLDSAIKQAWVRVDKTGLTPFNVGPDDLVNASEISRRWGVSREAARKAIHKSDFPLPIHIVAGAPMWSWKDVAKRLFDRKRIDSEKYAFASRLYEITHKDDFLKFH
jgi:hypothetical protein